MADSAPKDRPPLRALKPDEAEAAKPKRGRPPKAAKADTKPRSVPAGRKAPLKDRTEQFIGGIALAVSVFDAKDGFIIMESASDMAEAWNELANQNPRVRATLEKVLTGGAWGAVIMVHGSVAFRIAQNHGLVGELTFPIGPESKGDNDGSGNKAGNDEPGSGANTPRGVSPSRQPGDTYRVDDR